MGTLYAVTHTGATHHLDGLVWGWFDSMLTERGERQAVAAAEALRAAVPEGAAPQVFCSDLAHSTGTRAGAASASRCSSTRPTP